MNTTRDGFLPRATIFGIVALGSVVAAATAHADSLKQTVQHALEYHPEVRVLEANRRAIGEELNAAKGLILPGVRVEGRYGADIRSGNTQDYGEASIKLRQPIYTGGKYTSEKKRQEARVASAESRVADTVETIALQAVQAYLEVVRSRRVSERARKNTSAVSHIVNRVTRQVNGGGANQADLEQARARLYAARNAEATSEIQHLDALALFQTAVGRKPGKLPQPDLPTKALARSVDGLLTASAEASPKLMAIRYDADAANAAIGTANSELMPKLDLELSANYSTDLDGVSQGEESLKAMVVVSMSLYNGGINRARVREARERAEEAREQIAAAELTIERELRLAWNSHHGASKLVKNLLQQSRSNQRLAKIRLDQYESGLASLLSILDAQNESFVAGVQATNEFNAGKFSFFKMLAASGKLTKTLGVAKL